MASFNLLNLGNERNLQSLLLAAYSAVVTFALILVVSKNFETPEQIMEGERLAQVERQENMNIAASVSVPEVYDADSIETNNLTAEWELEVEESNPEVKTETIEVQKGDSFIVLLQKQGMEYADANQIANSLKKAGYDVRTLRVGQKIDITKTVDVPFGELISVDKIVIEPSAALKYVVTKNEDEEYVTEAEELELIEETQSVSGVINSSLAAAMKNVGVPQSVIGNFINIFSYTVDFRSDIKAGHTFSVLYDRKVAPDGKVVKNGDILYAELGLGKQKIKLYRYKDANGGVDYYNKDGAVLKRTLDRKPLEFRAARISSRFGWRRHPILKDRRLHSGIDYAAPKGSRIYASGDGVVKRAQYAGGYGNMVVIQHNNEYSTGYGHMNSFAKGIRPGVRVKQGQVIGYVGSTGRSTGPHLHFEIIKNGKKVDPLKVKAATGTNLAGNELKQFKAEVARIEALGKKVPVEVAELN